MFQTIKNIREYLDQVGQVDPAMHDTLQTALITQCILSVVYYIVLGLVIWALGRRIIQSIFAGIREAKRERT